MLLARERMKHFLVSLLRPIGVSREEGLEPTARNSARLPRTPRFVTVLLLAAVMTILVHPEVRMSLRSIASAYLDAGMDVSKWSSVRALRKEAERNRDPKLLALLMLLSHDADERIRLAGEAISRDSSLTWLTYENATWARRGSRETESAFASQLQRLAMWDPDNAATSLTTAEKIFGPFYRQQMNAVNSGHEENALREKLAQNREWVSAMSRTFSAPRYDDFTVRQFALIREVVRKYKVTDHEIVLFAQFDQNLPSLLNIRTYNDLLFTRAALAEQQGDFATAEANYSQALRFAQKMRAGSRTLLETMMAAKIGESACANLQRLLEHEGKFDEARLVGFALAVWPETNRVGSKSRAFGGEDADKTMAAIAFQGAALAVALCGFFTVGSFSLVWLGRRRPLASRGNLCSLACFTADIAPMLLLFSCVALFWTYHPFAQAYSSYMTMDPASMNSDDFAAFAGTVLVSEAIPNAIRFIQQPILRTYYAWLTLTTLLCLTLMYFVFRMTQSRRVI